MEGNHEPVLLQEVIEGLGVRPDDVVVDATVGGAGHFEAFLKALGPSGVLVGIDADGDALVRAQEKVDNDPRATRPTVHLVEDNFRNLEKILETLSLPGFDRILFDLGWSGYQLRARRGFSFQQDEPLLMTYGAHESQTAAELVNSAPERDLADLLYSLGEERFARGIARAIVAARERSRILTTGALVNAIRSGTPRWYEKRRVHPATKTFQALRMAVNDELAALKDGLSAALAKVSSGGRIGVITFHSIEDRIVKNLFRDAAYEGKGMLGTKKPITPSREEIAGNRRSRSAKLRIFERSALRTAPAPKNRLFSYA